MTHGVKKLSMQLLIETLRSQCTQGWFANMAGSSLDELYNPAWACLRQMVQHGVCCTLHMNIKQKWQAQPPHMHSIPWLMSLPRLKWLSWQRSFSLPGSRGLQQSRCRLDCTSLRRLAAKKWQGAAVAIKMEITYYPYWHATMPHNTLLNNVCLTSQVLYFVFCVCVICAKGTRCIFFVWHIQVNLMRWFLIWNANCMRLRCPLLGR